MNVLSILSRDIKRREPYINYIIAKLPIEDRREYAPKVRKLVLAAQRIEYGQRLAAQSVEDIKTLLKEGELILSSSASTFTA
jgi:hypothetical protein